MIEKIGNNIWKIKADSNLYFLNIDNPTIIDTGRSDNRELITKLLKKLIDPEKIEKVIFTHLHYDHIGNFDLFPNAKFYASKTEIESFKKDPFGTVLDEETLKRFKVELNPIESNKNFEIINSPGHTKGSICIWYEKEKILFSGDTLLKEGHGRTDLPTSAPNKLQDSLVKLSRYKFKYLATGHEY